MDFFSSGLGLTLAQDERTNWSPLLGALRRKGMNEPFEGTLEELFAQNMMPSGPSIQDLQASFAQYGPNRGPAGERPGLGQYHWDSPAMQRYRQLYPSLHPGTSLQTAGPNMLGTSASPGAWFPSTQQSYGALGSAPANTTIGGNPTGLGFAPSPQLGSNAAFGFSGSPTNQLGGF